MMLLEEIERLLVDIFINNNSNDVTTLCSEETTPLLGGTIGMIYNNYIHSFSSKDNCWNCMLGSLSYTK